MNGLWWIAAVLGLVGLVVVLDQWERRITRADERRRAAGSQRRLLDEIRRHEP